MAKFSFPGVTGAMGSGPQSPPQVTGEGVVVPGYGRKSLGACVCVRLGIRAVVTSLGYTFLKRFLISSLDSVFLLYLSPTREMNKEQPRALPCPRHRWEWRRRVSSGWESTRASRFLLPSGVPLWPSWFSFLLFRKALTSEEMLSKL